MTAQMIDRDDTELVALLVARAQAGDREAFGELVQRYERAIFSIALRRLRDYCEAEELTQEVFLQAFTKLDQLRDAHCFGGWLRSITVRMSINRAVRRPNDVATEPEILAATVVDGREPIELIVDCEDQAEVRRCLEKLGDIDRRTLEAFYFEGQSLVEMSDAFRAPVGTIKRRLHVARKRLAKEVGDLVAV